MPYRLTHTNRGGNLSSLMKGFAFLHMLPARFASASRSYAVSTPDGGHRQSAL